MVALPLIKRMLSSDEWEVKESGILALGAIAEGGAVGVVLGVGTEGDAVTSCVRKGHLSNEDTVCSPNHTRRAVYKSTSELGTPFYTGQPTGSRWCPL